MLHVASNTRRVSWYQIYINWIYRNLNVAYRFSFPWQHPHIQCYTYLLMLNCETAFVWLYCTFVILPRSFPSRQNDILSVEISSWGTWKCRRSWHQAKCWMRNNCHVQTCRELSRTIDVWSGALSFVFVLLGCILAPNNLT